MTCPDFEIIDCLFPLTLPKGAKIKVEENKKVSKGDVLAIIEEEFQDFDLAAALSVSPKKISQYLLVSLGSEVCKDQVLACKKGLFGIKVEFRSPISGILAQVSEDGILKIKTNVEKKEILSPMEGSIKEVSESLLTIEFRGLKISGSWGEGPLLPGELKLCGGREEEIKLQDLGPLAVGKILVTGGKIPLWVYHKAEALGIAGILGNSIAERIRSGGLAIITLDGKDEFMPLEIWKELEKREGNGAIISGSEKFLAVSQK